MLKNFALTDETLHINATTSYHLSMRAGADGFCYCILDSTRNKFIAAKCFPFHIDDIYADEFHEKIIKIINEDEYLNCKYKGVRFVYYSPKATIVPAPLFDKENLKAFYNFNHLSHDLETLHYNKLKSIDAYTIFSLPYNIVETVYIRFSNAKLYHQSTPFIEHAVMRPKTKGSKSRVLISVNRLFFDIAVVGSSSLQLYNNFLYKTPDECVYFLTNIFDQLQLDPEDTELVVSGDITKTSEEFIKIKKIIKNVVFDKSNEHYTYSYIFNDIHSGIFGNLFNVNRCE